MLGTAVLAIVILLALALPVSAVMGWLGIILDQSYSHFGFYQVMGEVFWTHAHSFTLLPIPLFVFLGEVLVRSGIAARMYAAMTHWLGWLPGGLMHANIGASTMFAANSGSSVATAATISVLAIPEIFKRKYNERLFLGSIAAGGTLGILIPPSINMIIYGFLTDTSIPQLYLAGIIPGFLLAFFFMAVILIACLVRPEWGGVREHTDWPTRFRSLVNLLPPLFIFMLVVGSIYMGLATPTEAAALGVLGALVLAHVYRKLSLAMLKEAIKGTMRTTGMLLLIILMAHFLNFVLAAIGLVGAVNRMIANLGWSPGQTMIMIICMYMLLGMFMDALAMMILTVPVIGPVVFALGFDPVWFGVVVMLMCETALITPPVGINVYVVQGVRGRGALNDVTIGILPYLCALLAMIAMLLINDDIALYLPKLFYR
ncbi:TRAP transporter large permease [Shumkonia mesophila]|uniref:TRAP transporter large permease n=1 Tax=Shumkonia mesophila TaxID=2838854 RepID=UPI00293482E9|nr:TRAP transporter large permease [Shumkonia mesophila]